MPTLPGQKRIMVFGTFDGLHEGHLDFFKQAKKTSRNPFLIVSIGRDKNVKIIKGRRPVMPEKKRLSLIRKSKVADKVVMSGARNHILHIMRERPDIIALGYDQKFYVKNLKEDLRKKGLIVKIVRLKPYKEKIFKNHLLKGNKFTTPNPSSKRKGETTSPEINFRYSSFLRRRGSSPPRGGGVPKAGR